MKECDPNLGIPFWIVNDVNKEDWIVNIFADVINDYQEYLNARESLDQFLKPKIETTTNLFSVVHNPIDKRIRTKTDVFEIELKEKVAEIPETSIEIFEVFKMIYLNFLSNIQISPKAVHPPKVSKKVFF